METRGGEGFVQGHSEIEDVDDVEQGLADNGWAAGGAEGEDGLTVVQDDGRAHAGERTVARGGLVGCGADEAEMVCDAGVDGGVVHLVVHDDAAAGDGEYGAE